MRLILELKKINDTKFTRRSNQELRETIEKGIVAKRKRKSKGRK